MLEFLGSAFPLTRTGVDRMLDSADLGEPELWSILSVETTGCGYLVDRRPKILFERHVFSRLTQHKYDADDPNISQPAPGGYGRAGANQYDRLNAAMQLDQSAALMSASWGVGQIMGENFAVAGFQSVEEMITAMCVSEDNQCAAMMSFMREMKLLGPLKAHDWAGFARRYNGPNCAANNYDGLLEHFYERYAQGPLPDLVARAIQVLLLFRGFQPGPIDGVVGVRTKTAILQFQQSAGLPETAVADSTVLETLQNSMQSPPVAPE